MGPISRRGPGRDKIQDGQQKAAGEEVVLDRNRSRLDENLYIQQWRRRALKVDPGGVLSCATYGLKDTTASELDESIVCIAGGREK